MLNKLHTILIYISLTLLLSACGGGGGGAGSTNHAPVLSAIADVSMVAGNSKAITLAATDQDNNTISFTVSGGSPSTVNASISGNQLTLAASPGFSSSTAIPFTVTANDGNGGTNSTTFNVSVTIPTNVILKFSAAGIPGATPIGSISASVILPAGITPSILTDNLIDTSLIGTVKNASESIIGYNPNDVISLTATYTLVTTTVNSTPYTARNLKVTRLSTSGFAPEEFIAINCTIASGTTVSASDFGITATLIEALDTNANDFSGVTLPISVTFQ